MKSPFRLQEVSSSVGWPWEKDVDPETYDSNIAWPKISIVTPSFNQGKYIEETIRSVLLQNYPNLEYIIVDGGSTDETIDIIKKYESWITWWVSEKDRGQSHAINKGFERCTGKIFNWLNSDDYYFPDTFYHVANTFLNKSGITTVSGKELHLQLDGTSVSHDGTFITKSVVQTIEFAEMAQPSTFFLAECFKSIGPVAEDLHYIMDGEFWVRYLLMYGQNSFCKINRPLVNFRKHSASKTVQSSIIYNFLFERSSIIVDLQRFSHVPEKIISYWINEEYKTTKIYQLNRNWKFNNAYVSRRTIRLYFIKKYFLVQLQKSNKAAAFWAVKQLLKNICFDWFMIKSLLKLVIKKSW